MLSWPPKDPDEILDYNVNWADVDMPVLAEGESILTYEFILEDGSVSFDSDSQADGICTVWISGGVTGEVNVITNRINTSSGRTYDQSVKLRIRAK